MLQSGKFKDKQILLIDREEKKHNDRTWCFWETKPGYFDEIVYRQWQKLGFISPEFTSVLNISPYTYKMIRGKDFYDHCFSIIRSYATVDLLYAEIDPRNFWYDAEERIIKINEMILDAKESTIFNSIYTPVENNKHQFTLLQHFKGWEIETEEPAFDTDKSLLMDFRVHQDHGTTFAYVLPFSEKRALVEYTLFTKNLLENEQYNIELKNYIEKILFLPSYRIIGTEFGTIPMTSHRFEFWQNGMVHIGTAGGQTKASSGYTFRFIQKQSENILQYLLSHIPLNKLPITSCRFLYYDKILLNILYHNRFPGKKIFTELFRKNPPQKVLKFLDNETNLPEELRIISSLPTWPFLKTAMRIW